VANLTSRHLWPVVEVRRPVGGRKGEEKKREKEKRKNSKKFKKIKILLKIVYVSADQTTSAGRYPVSKIRPKLAGND